MISKDNTIQSEGLGSFFKKLGRISAKAGKKLATNVLKKQLELWKLHQTSRVQQLLEVLKHLYQACQN